MGGILKDTLAIICGKIVYHLGKKITPCSSLPGKIALNLENLYKNLDKIKDLSKIEMVTRVYDKLKINSILRVLNPFVL